MGCWTVKDLDASFVSIIESIKADIFQTRNKVLLNANKELISMYFRIGKIIDENAKYGNNFINELSKQLKIEFPDADGYSPRNLARMRKFYVTYGDLSNLPPAVANLTWTHNCILTDKVKELNKRIWYAEKCLENGWSKVVLDHQIDLELYERQADPTKKLTNYDRMLPTPQSEFSREILKDPYIFELAGLKEKMVEKDIEKAMLEQIKVVLLELGKGFSFVGNQYRVSTPDNDYLIDLLFYHLNLRCYVVVELKNSSFKPDFIGQLQFYITAIDETLKKEQDNPTIGLLLCKGKDKYSVEWSLKSTTAPIGVASYEIRNYLPTEEELNRYLK
ncbi:MAG: DUF1016 family protein [Clostridia bacterium]|nr:DUF1016 family protein [Clostridia bacterium]